MIHKQGILRKLSRLLAQIDRDTIGYNVHENSSPEVSLSLPLCT